MIHLFQHSPDNPYHISVGAVLVNADGDICVHKLVRDLVPDEFDLGGLEEAYILMRESLDNNESLEAAVLRGIHEEFGAEGTIKRYLGSLRYTVTEGTQTFEKTTLYFEIALTRLWERDGGDEEAFTILDWLPPDLLYEKMRTQGAVSTRNDADESEIIDRYRKTLAPHS